MSVRRQASENHSTSIWTVRGTSDVATTSDVVSTAGLFGGLSNTKIEKRKALNLLEESMMKIHEGIPKIYDECVIHASGSDMYSHRGRDANIVRCANVIFIMFIAPQLERVGIDPTSIINNGLREFEGKKTWTLKNSVAGQAPESKIIPSYIFSTLTVYKILLTKKISFWPGNHQKKLDPPDLSVNDTQVKEIIFYCGCAGVFNISNDDAFVSAFKNRSLLNNQAVRGFLNILISATVYHAKKIVWNGLGKMNDADHKKILEANQALSVWMRLKRFVLLTSMCLRLQSSLEQMKPVVTFESIQTTHKFDCFEKMFIFISEWMLLPSISPIAVLPGVFSDMYRELSSNVQSDTVEHRLNKFWTEKSLSNIMMMSDEAYDGWLQSFALRASHPKVFVKE